MRSKKTTNILLLLAFLFILTIIILCLLPTKSGPADTPLREGLGGDEPTKTTSRAPTKTTIRSPVTTKVTTSTPMELSTTSTVKEEYEKTSSTERTTIKKYLPSTTMEEEKSSTQPPVTSSPTSSTTLKLTTPSKYVTSTTTQHSTHKETEPHNETYILFESSTETFSVNETANITSAPSTTTPTTLGTTIATLATSTITTTTTTNTTTSPPTTYTTTTTTTTPPTTTTTTTPPTTTPPASTTTTTTTPPTTTTTTTTPPASTTTTTPPTTTTTTTPPTTTTTTTPPTTTTTTTTTPPASTTTTTTPPTTTTTTTPPTTTTTTPPTTIPYDHTFTLYTEPEGVCTSDGCKDMSGKMLDSIDHETDPCEDFHEYSCGGVHKDELLRPENAEETLDEILKEQLVSNETYASKFYNSCLSYLDGTENLKHEKNFPPNLIIDPSESEITEWPSENLTNTISYLIKRDLPVLFDMTVEVRRIEASIKILPKLRISLFDDYKDHYDHKYCIDQYSRRMLERNNKGKEKKLLAEEEEEEIIDVDINAEYQQYLECMNTTGLDLRINRLESVLKESDLFAQGLNPRDKHWQVNKVRNFLIDLNGILFPLTDTEETETTFDNITLGELIGNTALGGLIKWESLLESLLGFKLNESQQIIVEDVQKFSRLFSYLKKTWSDGNLENVLLMLAGEKLFKKGEDREHKKNFCFKITKKYLPLDMQLLFTKSYSQEDLNVLISEISNLGESLAAEITKITRSYYNVPTHVEFFDLQTLKSNMELLKSQLKLSGHYLDDLSILQTSYRKDMYSMTGQELKNSESCRLLQREIQFDCNLHMDTIIIPLEQLVAPNFYFRKDLPNYLRLEGVVYYYLKKFMALVGTDALNLKDYKENICLIQNIPTHFEERNSKLRIKYQTHFTEEMKSETLMEFQTFNFAWQGIKMLMSKKSGDLKVNETKELPLIWLGAESLHPLKAFLIRKAQESCNENKDFDLLRISRFKSPPKSFWINSLVKIDSLFGGAWHCASNTSMAETRECPPEPTTKDWYDPYSVVAPEPN